MRGPFYFTTTLNYDDTFVQPDAATVRIDIYTDTPVLALLFRGPHGQAIQVGEFPMSQSQTIAGASGVALKTFGNTAANVTVVCWQIDDPLPVAVPVGAGQIPTPTPPVTVPALTNVIVLTVGLGNYT